MTAERADLSIGLSVERMAPASGAPLVPDQSVRGNAEDKARRRPPAPEETSAETLQEDDAPQHRIDSLA